MLDVDEAVLSESLASWNQAVVAGKDVLGRPRSSMVALETRLILSGRCGRSSVTPRAAHAMTGSVVNPYGEPIHGLYVAGELGSIWGALYTAGCNLAECFITGKLAAEHAMGVASD